MIELKTLQREVYDNKVAHGFNVTSMDTEFCLLYGEAAEAHHAYWFESREAFAEELADVAIYLLGMAEIAGVDLEAALVKKIAYNKTRVYRKLGNGSMEKVEEDGQP